MAKKRGRGKRILKQEENAEDWCFECKDGGELMICDYKNCLKAYHPACVEKDDSVFTSDKPWICGRHKCLVCHESSNYHCYCCDRAACSRCIDRIEFVQLKGKYGFCNNCLKLALLVEEDRNIDSDGESVDLRDWETYEGLFSEYYKIVKEKEGFVKNSLLAGKALLDKEKICQVSSASGKHSEEKDQQLSWDKGDFSDEEPQKKRLKMRRSTQQKTKMQRSVNSKKKEFVGWGSKALIDFLLFIGKDTREKLSRYDVSSIITKYIKELNLIHPVQKTKILCDTPLQAVFGKELVTRSKILSLLESHFVENEEPLQMDKLYHNLEDDDTEMVVAPKTEKKVEQNKLSSIWYSTAAQSQFAALIPENIKLVYLKRSLLLEMIKQPESIETKIIGSFVRVKLDPLDSKQRNSHQLVQITGIKHGSSDKCNYESLIQVSNMARDVFLNMLSDAEISKEECDDLREKVKAGLLKKLTIVELEQKAKILHEDISKHRIDRELALLQNLINNANEKGWRCQLFQYLQKKSFLQQPSYLSFVLQNIPRVIPEEVELESLDRNDNQMHQCLDETTSMKQNIAGVTLEEVDLEPLDKDEKDVNQMHQCLDETTPTKKTILGMIPEEVELESLERNDIQMHQCSDETTPVKQNIPGVTPDKVELEPLSKDGKDINQMHHCLDETTPMDQNIPGMNPEVVELESLDRNDNQMHQLSDETTPVKQNMPRVTREKVELEPLSKDEKDVNQMHQCLDESETTLMKQKIPGATPEKVELEPLSKEGKDINQMHQCLDETTPTKKNTLGVTPEEVDLESLDRNDNMMHQCSDETTTPMKQNIPRVPEEVELEPLSKDEKDVNQMHQCFDEITPTKKNILGVIPAEVELERLARDKKDVNQMQHLNDTTPTKNNILRVIPEEVELECLAEYERDGNKMRQCTDETTPTGVVKCEPEDGAPCSDKHSENEDEKLSSDNGEPQKKRLKKKRCTQQKTKMQRRVNSKKKEFVGWGSKALIDFLQFIGKDTREKLSRYDVSSIVTKYIKEHNLMHPVQKTRILCDAHLQAVFGKKVVDRRKIFSLIKSHFIENEERLLKDDHDLEDDDAEMLVAPKTEKKVERNKISSIWYSTAAQSQFAALIPENIKLVYLKRGLLLEMIKQPESIETKIIGSFVRVKLDPRDCEQRNSHQLVQITGIKHGSSDKCNSESLIQVSNMSIDVSLNMLSDAEISKEECDDLREKVKEGLLKKLTIMELEQKAKILHEDITKHRIDRELALLQNLINNANEKGWRDQHSQYLEKQSLLQQPLYLLFMLQNIPIVIPEEVELESLDRNDNQMHQCLAEI